MTSARELAPNTSAATPKSATPKARTAQEILERIDAIEARDFFGTIRGDLISCLPFEHARPWLKDDATSESWGAVQSADAVSVLARMLDYMSFAWGKANDERGLSAARSLDHMSAWLWLLREDSAADALRDYSHYGKPQLRAICDRYGWDWRQWDNGDWPVDEGGPYVGPDDVPAARLWPPAVAPAEASPQQVVPPIREAK